MSTVSNSKTCRPLVPPKPALLVSQLESRRHRLGINLNSTSNPKKSSNSATTTKNPDFYATTAMPTFTWTRRLSGTKSFCSYADDIGDIRDRFDINNNDIGGHNNGNNGNSDNNEEVSKRLTMAEMSASIASLDLASSTKPKRLSKSHSRRLSGLRQLLSSFKSPKSKPPSRVSTPVIIVKRSETDMDMAKSSKRSSSSSCSSEEMSSPSCSSRDVFNIAKELASSERDFVSSLQLLNIDFREFVMTAKSQSNNAVIPDEAFQRLFSNLLELQILNSDLLKDFESRIEHWDTKPMIADVIVRKGPFLKLYTSYIRDFASTSTHYLDCLEKYPDFAKIVIEFEEKPLCRGLKIAHFLLKPVQRLPQYRLILEQYIKKLELGHEDYNNALEALQIVSEAAQHANEKIKQSDNFERLLELQSRLGERDLIQPNRELIKFGPIAKLSRGGLDQRYLILCSDILIYAKFLSSMSFEALRTAYRIPLATLRVQSPSAKDEYPCDLNIISPVRSCTLRAATEDERDQWLNAIEQAVQEHLSKQASFSTKNNNNNDSTGASLGSIAPLWVPDHRVTMCQVCHCEFSLLVRRHHCRACGKVVCYACSAFQAPLKYMAYQACRVCLQCFEKLQTQSEVDECLGQFSNRFRRRELAVSQVQRSVPTRLKVTARDKSAQMSGYLHFRKNRRYKKLWFVLKDRVLYAYRAPEDTVANQTTPILGFDFHLIEDIDVPRELLEAHVGGRCFELSHVGSPALRLFAESAATADKWTQAFLEAVAF